MRLCADDRPLHAGDFGFSGDQLVTGGSHQAWDRSVRNPDRDPVFSWPRRGQLRARVESVPDRGYERADFQSFVFVRSGSYTHTVGFEVHECNAGSCLVIRPGQVHRFGPRSDWDGWILIAGPQHVPDTVADLPQHIRLGGPLASAVTESSIEWCQTSSCPWNATGSTGCSPCRLECWPAGWRSATPTRNAPNSSISPSSSGIATSVSHELGFDEATNFVKYFKRETGTTPNQLRAHLRSDKPT